MVFKKYAYFLIIFLGAAPLWAQSISLENEIEKLRTAYAYHNEEQINTVLDTVQIFQSNTDKALFQNNTLLMIRFLVRLHPVEQDVYVRLLKLYKHYAYNLASFQEWMDQVFSYKRHFTSYLSPKEHRPYENNYQYLWEKAKNLLGYYPLTDTLKKYNAYWTALFNYQNIIPLPSWHIFQRETEDIQRSQNPFFLWEKRLETTLANIHKRELLKTPIQWRFEEDADTFGLTCQIIVQQDKDTIVRDAVNHKEALFKRIFKTWEVKSLRLKDEKTLSVTIANRGMRHHLTFDILEEAQTDPYRLFFTLQVPLLLQAAFLSHFEITYQVASHPEFEDLSVIRVHNQTRFPFETSKDLANLDQAKKQLKRRLPIELEQFRQHLYFLKN